MTGTGTARAQGVLVLVPGAVVRAEVGARCVGTQHRSLGPPRKNVEFSIGGWGEAYNNNRE